MIHRSPLEINRTASCFLFLYKSTYLHRTNRSETLGGDNTDEQSQQDDFHSVYGREMNLKLSVQRLERFDKACKLRIIYI